MYAKLKEAGYEITSVKEKLLASIMTDEEMALFQVKEKGALVNRIRMLMADNKPIEYTYSSYIAEGYELTIDLK